MKLYSHKYVSVIKDESGIASTYIFMVSKFEINRSHFVHRVTCSVQVDCSTGHMLGWDIALQHGLVLNPSLISDLEVEVLLSFSQINSIS